MWTSTTTTDCLPCPGPGLVSVDRGPPRQSLCLRRTGHCPRVPRTSRDCEFRDVGPLPGPTPHPRGPSGRDADEVNGAPFWISDPPGSPLVVYEGRDGPGETRRPVWDPTKPLSLRWEGLTCGCVMPRSPSPTIVVFGCVPPGPLEDVRPETLVFRSLERSLLYVNRLECTSDLGSTPSVPSWNDLELL